MSPILLGVQENIIWTRDTSYLTPLNSSGSSLFSLLTIHLMSNSIGTLRHQLFIKTCNSLLFNSIVCYLILFLSFLTQLISWDLDYRLFLKTSSPPHSSPRCHMHWQKPTFAWAPLSAFSKPTVKMLNVAG